MQIVYTYQLRKFLNKLNPEVQDKFDEIITFFNQSQGLLREPYCKKISKYIFEFRIKMKINVRIFFTYDTNVIILLHGYVKKTKKVPKRELLKAVKTKKMLFDKYNK